MKLRMNTDNYQKVHNSRRILVLTLNIAILIMVAIFFIGIDNIAINARKLPQLTGSRNDSFIHLVSRQQDVFPIYETAGLWGSRVIHLNRFFNMQEYSPKEQFVTTHFPVQVTGMKSAYERGIDSHNWLFIATRTGLVRTMTTVLPEQVFAELVKKSPNDRVFTYAAGTIRGYTYDIPRTITTLNDLPEIEEPVVVNVDAGYFSGGADPSGTSAVLKKKCRDIRMLVMIDSLDEPEVTDAMREQLRQFEAAWRTL